MKTKKPKLTVSPLAYKLILSAGITLLLISIHYSYFSPASYGDWMLGALAALVNSLIWGLRAPWAKLAVFSLHCRSELILPLIRPVYLFIDRRRPAQ